jgi:hypothetical protein
VATSNRITGGCAGPLKSAAAQRENRGPTIFFQADLEVRILRGCIVFLGFGPAVFMGFDGLRALILGDYMTPKTGRFAGQVAHGAASLERWESHRDR